MSRTAAPKPARWATAAFSCAKEKSSKRALRTWPTASKKQKPNESAIMFLTIHFMAQLKNAAGTASIQVDVGESATLKDVAAQAAERCGNSLRAILLDDKGAPRSGVLAFCGDQQVGWEDPVKGATEV